MIQLIEKFGNHYYFEDATYPDITVNDLYLSPSTICGVIADSNFVSISKATKGVEEHKDWFNELANDGKAVHDIMKNYVEQNNTISSLQIQAILYEFNVESESYNKITRAILSFVKFIKDYNFVFDFVEMKFIDENQMIAGQIDGVGTYTIYDKKGKIKRTGKAIIDWKTGNYTTLPVNYKYQINYYEKYISNTPKYINETLERFVVCPTAWIKNPDYRVFEVQSVDIKFLNYLKQLYIDKEENEKNNRHQLFKPIYDFGKVDEFTAETQHDALITTEFLKITSKMNVEKAVFKFEVINQ